MKPDKRIINIKIYVDGRSEEIQKKLFELGCEWPVSGKCPCYTDSPFLYVNGDRMLSAGNKMTNFARNDYREVKADEILAMKKMEEYRSIDGFKPFEKVLMRDGDEFEWRPKLFSRVIMDEECSYFSIDGFEFKYCIPYEGNEHLAFTKDIPKQLFTSDKMRDFTRELRIIKHNTMETSKLNEALPAVLERVKSEKDELDERIHRLAHFLCFIKPDVVDAGMRELMQAQLGVMEAYAAILGRRIMMMQDEELNKRKK